MSDPGPAQLKELVSLLFKTDDTEKINSLNYKDFEQLDLLAALPREHENIYDDYGTKWMSVNSVEHDDDEEYPYLEIDADTAWGPPTRWIERLGKKYEFLRIRDKYDEPGNGFLGVAMSNEGEFTNESIDY